MPFRNQRPTLQDLITRVQNDFISRLSLVGSILRRSFIYVITRVQAGSIHELYGQLEFISRQVFADQAEAEYLDRKGSLYDISRLAATYSTGLVVFTGTNGVTIPANTIVQRADGITYETQTDGTISAGTVSIVVLSQVAGVNSNCNSGVVLSLISPIIGVNTNSTVHSSGLNLGNDIENDENYRQRILARTRTVPQGGAAADYIVWAKQVAGVTRAWVFPLELGAGTVTVRFTRDNDISLIPDAGEVTQVQTYIDVRRPVTATVTVVAPIADTLNLTIHIVPDTVANRAAVQNELIDLLAKEDLKPGDTLFRSQILTAVGIAGTITDFAVTVPAADVTHITGHLSVLGVITWV